MNIRVATDTAQVRACSPDDMPAVAGLFQRTFRSARRAAPASLTAYLRELYFEHPWRDPALASKVFVADGAVRGFIGILPLRLAFRGGGIAGLVNRDLLRVPPADAAAHDAEASDEHLIRLIPELASAYEVRPAWDPE